MKYVKPKKRHEDNIKLDLARVARSSGLFLHLEYTHKRCRFDCVLVREKQILAIIEVKNWTIGRAVRKEKDLDHQLRRYSSFDIPLYVLWSHKGVGRLLHKLQTIAGQYDKNKQMPKKEIKFYPEPAKNNKKTELQVLIAQQLSAMRSNSRHY